MTETLQYWNNGEPVIPDDSLTDMEYWLNGEPYTIHKPAAGPSGGIMNQFQRSNLGADLYNGGFQ